MVIRMIEYDFAVGLENVQKENGKYRIYFPQSCVLYLRGKEKKNSISVELLLPNGKTAEYTVPVVQVQRFTSDDLFQKHLLFLLPYYVMRYEKENNLDTDDEKLKKLLEEYAEIRRCLEKQLLHQGKEKVYRDMIELITRIANYVFRESEKVKKGFGEIMGGKVLELESDRLIQRGIEQGIAMERKNSERERQELKKAEAEIQRLKKLLEEQTQRKEN